MSSQASGNAQVPMPSAPPEIAPAFMPDQVCVHETGAWNAQRSHSRRERLLAESSNWKGT